MFGFLGIANHAELPEELAPELFLFQELPGLRVGDVAEALQPVQRGLIAHTESVSEHRDVLVVDPLRTRRRAKFRVDAATARDIEDGLFLAAWKPLVETPQRLVNAVPRHEKRCRECVCAPLDHFR